MNIGAAHKQEAAGGRYVGTRSLSKSSATSDVHVVSCEIFAKEHAHAEARDVDAARKPMPLRAKILRAIDASMMMRTAAISRNVEKYFLGRDYSMPVLCAARIAAA